MPPHSHRQPVPVPGNFALHSSDHVPTRSSPGLQPTEGICLCHCHYSARSPLSQPALTTTARLLADCHAPVLNVPTTLLAVGLEDLTPLLPQVADSKQHVPIACFPSPHFRREPPVHTHGSSPAS